MQEVERLTVPGDSDHIQKTCCRVSHSSAKRMNARFTVSIKGTGFKDAIHFTRVNTLCVTALVCGAIKHVRVSSCNTDKLLMRTEQDVNDGHICMSLFALIIFGVYCEVSLAVFLGVGNSVSRS